MINTAYVSIVQGGARRKLRKASFVLSVFTLILLLFYSAASWLTRIVVSSSSSSDSLRAEATLSSVPSFISADLPFLSSINAACRRQEQQQQPSPRLSSPPTSINSTRFHQVRSTISQAWSAYRNDVLLHGNGGDDLQPLTRTGNDWLHAKATLYDSLDTLYLAGLHTEFEEAVDYCVTYDTISLLPTKTFEYSIRVVGGLLGAYSVSGRNDLFSLAVRQADAMLQTAFAHSPTVLPRPFDVLQPSVYQLRNDGFLGWFLPSTVWTNLSLVWGYMRGSNTSSTRRRNRFLSLCIFLWNTNARILHRIWASLYSWGRDSKWLMRGQRQHVYNSLAGVGTFSLEFEFLSKQLMSSTSDGTSGAVATAAAARRFQHAADSITRHIASSNHDDDDQANKREIGTKARFRVRGLHHDRLDASHDVEPIMKAKRSPPSLYDSSWNVLTGKGAGGFSSLGSGSDSFYEYLLKTGLLKRQETDSDNIDRALSAEDYLAQYQELVVPTLVGNGSNRNTGHFGKHLFAVEGHNRYNHLLCFLPGLLALGEHENVHNGDKSNSTNRILQVAHELAEACFVTYNMTTTGLGPEEVMVKSDGTFHIVDSRYQLRPELVESLFVLWRHTGKEQYREWAWQIFQSIERYCKVIGDGTVAGLGYSSLNNVNSTSGNDPRQRMSNDMPSFFLGETLKYLLLIFAPHDYVSLDDYVFTTEAHPLRRNQHPKVDFSPCLDIDILVNPPMSFWMSLLCNAMVVLVLLGCCQCFLCCSPSLSNPRWNSAQNKRQRRRTPRLCDTDSCFASQDSKLDKAL